MLHDRRPIVRVLLNPLLVSLVLVAVLTAGWLLYTSGGTSIAQARPGGNLLPPLAPSPVASANSVGGWSASHSADASTSLELIDGQLNERALELEISNYASGDVTLTSPRVDVEPETTYLFKAFANGDVDFSLLVRRHSADGSTILQQLSDPIERPSSSPSTVSDAFESGDTTVAVEYVFRLASAGTLRIEGAFLEAADDVRPPAIARTTPNLIPNPELAGPQPGTPDSWSPYASGTATVESGSGKDEAGNYVWTRIANYQGGEAKWQYEPVPVSTDRYFKFGATYRAEREVDVVAEFELTGGGRAFHNLATIQPASDWTTIEKTFQVPEEVQTAMVTLVSHGNGTTGVRDYSLSDITKPGPLRWDRPVISITFDDGWQSVHERALPLLDVHDFGSTQYVNARTIETPGFMKANDIQQMHEAGHEIAARSYDDVDLTSIGVDRLDEVLRRSRTELASADLDTNNLAIPYGRHDPQVDWYTSRYFDVVRGTDPGINTRQNLNLHDLKVFYVTNETTLESLAAAIAETSQLDGWLVLVYHQIAAPESGGGQDTIPADRSTVTSDALAAQLQLIDDSGIEVRTVAQTHEQLLGQ